MSRERHDRRYDGADDGYLRRESGSRRYSRDRHDYSGMYDEGREADRRGRYDNQRYREDVPAQGNRNSRTSRSPGNQYRHSRSSSTSSTQGPGTPTDTILLEGVPFCVSSTELADLLTRNTSAANFRPIDVRIPSSTGTRRAFVQFGSVDLATTFVQEHFPDLRLKLQHCTDEVPDGQFEVYIHFARPRGDGPREDLNSRGQSAEEWKCPNPACGTSNYLDRAKCRTCGGSPSALNWSRTLTGAGDVSGSASQILVVYPLAEFVNEDMLAVDMKRLELDKPDPSDAKATDGPPKLKSTAPTNNPPGYGATPNSLHRVFLIRDVNTEQSLNYGFAEFWTLTDATNALAKFRMAREWTVAGSKVTVAPIHAGVFCSEEREPTLAIERMSFNPLSNPTLRVRYRDMRVYPSRKLVTFTPPPGTELPSAKEPEADNAGGKKTKKRKAEGTIASSAAKKSVPLPLAGHFSKWANKHKEIVGGKHADGSSGEASAPNRSVESEPQPLVAVSATETTDLKAPKRRNSSSKEEVEEATATENTQSQSVFPHLIDKVKLQCLLCRRQFKTLGSLDGHERSENHLATLANDKAVSAALLKHPVPQTPGQTQVQGPAEPDDGPKYRDRARERRDAFNQPKKPAAQPAKPKFNAFSMSGKSAPPAEKPAPSKGAGMLAKMGWQSGGGLGAKGDGRTEVIQTNAFQEGVGLGAEGSNLGDAAKLAERKTKNDYEAYLHTVKDNARERYKKME